MGFKTITLSEEAYNRLKERKTGNESFSSVILRLTNNTSLRDFVGIVDDKLLDNLEKNIEKIREKRTEPFLKSIKDDWGK
jgi:predicted CopG family antitoxin